VLANRCLPLAPTSRSINPRTQLPGGLGAGSLGITDDHVDKGDQLGMFHFGGSTHCLIFRPEVKLEFELYGQKPGPSAETNIRINTAIARVL
jgi:hypothetical protein